MNYSRLLSYVYRPTRSEGKESPAVLPAAKQRAQACLSIPIIFHPWYAMAFLISPSYHARPSVLRPPGSLRLRTLRCSVFRTPCGLQMSQDRNVRVDMTPPQFILVSTLLHRHFPSTRAGGRAFERAARINHFAIARTAAQSSRRRAFHILSNRKPTEPTGRTRHDRR